MIVILHVMVRTDSALEDKINYRIKRHALVQYYFLSHCSLAVLVDQHPRHNSSSSHRVPSRYHCQRGVHSVQSLPHPLLPGRRRDLLYTLFHNWRIASAMAETTKAATLIIFEAVNLAVFRAAHLQFQLFIFHSRKDNREFALFMNCGVYGDGSLSSSSYGCHLEFRARAEYFPCFQWKNWQDLERRTRCTFKMTSGTRS